MTKNAKAAVLFDLTVGLDPSLERRKVHDIATRSVIADKKAGMSFETNGNMGIFTVITAKIRIVEIEIAEEISFGLPSLSL